MSSLSSTSFYTASWRPSFGSPIKLVPVLPFDLGDYGYYRAAPDILFQIIEISPLVIKIKFIADENVVGERLIGNFLEEVRRGVTVIRKTIESEVKEL